ncbi:polysaccharide pyruvyl transferase family protein [Halomonas sp. NO4]|uniref:polysaccharide pyruvyl transferase family protein n=1 Tax=Halomonas sp. NO4 TaxID=2484813 RepID=UPI0013D47DC9|nr:polysaccharide pyruvyl transferase family protein [Halomonas sp. NO4]
MTKGFLLARWSQPGLNWGDSLNPYLIQKLSKKKVYNVLYPRVNFFKVTQRLRVTNKPEYIVVGSVLSWGHFRDGVAEVWGAGFMSAAGRVKYKPKAIHAVRGELSRELLIKQGISCPKVFGDPALIMPYIYKPDIKTSSNLVGVIPHYVDKPFFSGENYPQDENLKVIDIEQDTESFIDQVMECGVVLSSSLHGLIVADAYGIPSRRVVFSNNISGGDFKFRDYYSGIGHEYVPPLKVDQISALYDIAGGCETHSISKDALSLLLRACPFLSLDSSLRDFI